jgi:hypothetical protein
LNDHVSADGLPLLQISSNIAAGANCKSPLSVLLIV